MRNSIRGILILSLLLISRTGAISQLYGNEWIDYNKSYYKITVAEEGIYRIEYQDLVDTGIPVNAIDGRKYQIFHRGIEQAIFEQNTGAVQLESGDFLEFYGQRNDGALDHSFVSNELEINVHLSPGEIETFSFILNEVGNYDFICAIPGHEDAGMVGEIVISE